MWSYDVIKRAKQFVTKPFKRNVVNSRDETCPDWYS